MWFLMYLVVFNAAASKTFINTYRLSFGFALVTMLDISLALGLLGALIFGGNQARKFPTLRVHPLFTFILVMLGLGFITGCLGAFMEEAPIELSMRNAREYIVWPISMIVGYRLLSTPEWARRWIYALVIAGMATAFYTTFRYAERAEDVTWGASVLSVRTVEYITAFAGVAALVLFYSILSPEVKLMPLVLALPIACFCLIGQCAPLHRTDWVAMMLCAAGLLWVLPKQNRVRVAIRGFFLIASLVVATLIALQIASAILNKDFNHLVYERLETLLPSYEGKQGHAWDTRIGSTMQEIQIWLENPLLGQGFGVQMTRVMNGKMVNTGSYFHNAITALLANTGIFGALGACMMIGSMVVIGRRLIRERVDRGSVLLGAAAYFAGLYMCICALTGMLFGSRAGLFFALLAGMMYRARDMQQTALASMSYSDEMEHDALLASQHEQSDGFVDPAFAHLSQSDQFLGSQSARVRHNGPEDEWA